MKKAFLTIFTALILFTMSVMPVSAATEDPVRLVDDANLLSKSEEKALLKKLDEISERQDLDIVIVTTYSLEGKTPTAYADDFFDYNGYGYGSDRDGILFLVSMEDRDWAISTSGYGIKVFTDAGLDYIEDKVIPYLSDGDYADGFDKFADLCDKFIEQANSGRPYDRGNMPKEALSILWIPGSIAIGAVIAFIGTGMMKSELKSVRRQKAASSYVRNGSMKLTASHEHYLYRNVTRRVRETSSGSGGGGSSIHTSSSGRSHGGSSGKF